MYVKPKIILILWWKPAHPPEDIVFLACDPTLVTPHKRSALRGPAAQHGKCLRLRHGWTPSFDGVTILSGGEVFLATFGKLTIVMPAPAFARGKLAGIQKLQALAAGWMPHRSIFQSFATLVRKIGVWHDNK